MGDEIVVRDVRPADGAALSRIWLDVAKYYVELDPDAFQVPDEEGLAQWFENDLREASQTTGGHSLPKFEANPQAG